jgi:hypothetical protein
VALRSGHVVPLPAVRLALDLQQRGIRLALDDSQQVVVAASRDLTDEDRQHVHDARESLARLLLAAEGSL